MLFCYDSKKNGILVKIIQEIDELCDDWVPEPLTPQISEEMMVEPPTLERFKKKNSSNLCLFIIHDCFTVLMTAALSTRVLECGQV